MNMTVNLNRVSEPTPYSYTKMMIYDVEKLDEAVAEIGNEKGLGTKVNLRDALEVYALWIAGRLQNSDAEIAYQEKNNDKTLPAFQI